MNIGLISPQDWGLEIAQGPPDSSVSGLPFTAGEIERRLRGNLYEWMPRQFDEENGAFYGYYRAKDGFREPPQTVNLIASWQLLAGYDRYNDEALLERARQALEFYYWKFVVSHPMSVVAGGARDGVASHEVWTKFSSEFLIGALGLYKRDSSAIWIERAIQSGRYLLQAARHGYAPKYRLDRGRWGHTEFGWDSWGRSIEALLELGVISGDNQWVELAARWGEHGLEVQASNGCFYLIDEEYYNTDLAADEIRGLTFLYEVTGKARYLEAARRFADWHLHHQRKDGAWVMTVDRDGNVVIPTVGPGDVPNIAIALLRLHSVTGEELYLRAAQRAFRYSLSTQVIPGEDQPFAEDPKVQWGFWSWDPYYDYSLSCDQATHHVRGMMFALDYLGNFD